MPAPFEDISNLDRLIHEPARLAILTALASCRAADFLFLQSLTGLTKGNLGGHLAKLKTAGLVKIDKSFNGNVPRTSIQITSDGRTAIERHWLLLDQLLRSAMRSPSMIL